jgi:hypothetical protein
LYLLAALTVLNAGLILLVNRRTHTSEAIAA